GDVAVAQRGSQDGDQRVVRGRVCGGGGKSGAAPGSLVLVRAAGAVGSGTSAHGHIPSGGAQGGREPVPDGAAREADGGRWIAALDAARFVLPARWGAQATGIRSQSAPASRPLDAGSRFTGGYGLGDVQDALLTPRPDPDDPERPLGHPTIV